MDWIYVPCLIETGSDQLKPLCLCAIYRYERAKRSAAQASDTPQREGRRDAPDRTGTITAEGGA